MLREEAHRPPVHPVLAPLRELPSSPLKENIVKKTAAQLRALLAAQRATQGLSIASYTPARPGNVTGGGHDPRMQRQPKKTKGWMLAGRRRTGRPAPMRGCELRDDAVGVFKP